MKKMTYLFSLSLTLIICCSFSIEKTPVFIQTFQDVAVLEMHRTQIPASITMAQAIIESAWGNGVLARSSNNFFGIKCKKNWEGDSFFIEDDDYDTAGNLTKSCFRAYESIEASFMDHSDFLVDSPRYAELFKLSTKDYVGWAYGLKACGYATDSLYAEKLIRKIEAFELYKLDYHNELLAAPTYSVEPPSTAPISTMEDEVILSAPAYIITERPQAEAIALTKEMPAPTDSKAKPKKQSMIIDNNFGAVPISVSTSTANTLEDTSSFTN